MRWQYLVATLIILYLLSRLFKPRITDLTAWLPKHPTRTFAKRNLSQIEQIVIHHSAGNLTDTIEQIANYHIGPNHVCADGCPGILYHFMIDSTGKAYQVNSLDTITYHLAGQNTKSIGVCFIGNYNISKPSIAQIKAANRIISFCKKQTNRNLSITNHGEACSSCTECPGNHLKTKF